MSAVPDLAEAVLTVTIGATIVFELAGPILTRLALDRMGERGADMPQPERA